MTGATIFTGGGLADLGMKAAGIDMRWGIEHIPEIAAHARSQGIPCTTADILACDPADFERVDCLHASPPCPNFSQAKAGGEETEHDIRLAEKCAEFISVLLPKIVTLENVEQYRKSRSWDIIGRTLTRCGYGFRINVLLASDYGVPQTRRRMIVMARLGRPAPGPVPHTHAREPKPAGLFGVQAKKWMSWYEAIEDILHTLPDSEFAPWQIARLPVKLRTMLIPGDNATNGVTRDGDERFITVQTRPTNRATHRAFVVGGTPDSNGEKITIKDGQEPFLTVAASHYKHAQRASISSGRVVQMTPRALARFQSIPDSYQLPPSNKLACTIIGNAAPPLLMQRIYEHLTQLDSTLPFT